MFRAGCAVLLLLVTLQAVTTHGEVKFYSDSDCEVKASAPAGPPDCDAGQCCDSSITVHTLDWKLGATLNTAVTCGDIVEWKWADGAPHTVKPDVFDSDFGWETLPATSATGNGDILARVGFTKDGSFTYKCGVHPTMTGTVTVTGCSPTAAPTTAAATTAAPLTTAPPLTTAAPATTAPPATTSDGSTTLEWKLGSTHGIVSVACGTTVRWNWADGAQHTVKPSVDDASFNWVTTPSSSTSGAGVHASITFTKNGDFPYVCGVHPLSMTGTIRVSGCGTTAAPTTAAATTAAPTTVAATTAAPTTVAATTAAPTTVAPTTAAPTTVAPTTAAPTTVAPTTPAPTTAAATTTAAPSRTLSWGLGSAHGIVEVACGTTVSWDWSDGALHTVKPSANDESFNWVETPQSSVSGAGIHAVVTFSKNGDFPYVCGVHASMTGTIRVSGCPGTGLLANEEKSLARIQSKCTVDSLTVNGFVASSCDGDADQVWGPYKANACEQIPGTLRWVKFDGSCAGGSSSSVGLVLSLTGLILPAVAAVLA